MLAGYQLASSIRGLRVTRAYRSHGSMIHFEFGRSCSHKPSRPQTYGLMVETARWEIKRRGLQLATDAAWKTKIDHALQGILNRRTLSIRLGARSSELGFENDLILKLSPGAAHKLAKLDNWVIFRGRAPALWLALDGTLRIPKAGRNLSSDHS